MHQSVVGPKYEGVRTSRKELMENEEEDNSGLGEDEEEGRVQFNVPSEK